MSLFEKHEKARAVVRLFAEDPDHPTFDEMAAAHQCADILEDFWKKWRAEQ